MFLTNTQVVTASYPVFLSTTLMIGMTTLCWWAFTFKREGFMPQMYGSIRACCSATTELDDFAREGVQWGDCKSFIHSLSWECPWWVWLTGE